MILRGIALAFLDIQSDSGANKHIREIRQLSVGIEIFIAYARDFFFVTVRGRHEDVVGALACRIETLVHSFEIYRFLCREIRLAFDTHTDSIRSLPQSKPCFNEVPVYCDEHYCHSDENEKRDRKRDVGNAEKAIAKAIYQIEERV